MPLLHTNKKPNPTQEKLAKLGLNHILEFALHPPQSYINTTMITTLQDGVQGALRVEIVSHLSRPNTLRIQAYMLDFDTYIEIVIFHPKSYHKRLFALHQTILIQGKLQYQYNQYSIIQPKVITQAGIVIPQFKIAKHKSSSIWEYAKEILTIENLLECGLPNEICQDIFMIFNPSEEFFYQYSKHKMFFGKYLYALKYTEVFYHFLSLSKKHLTFPSKFQCNGAYQEFIDSLPFTLTNDQMQVIKQIALDLASTNAAKRLIMGDVGCGKTMIILASVLIAYPYKSLLMTPTTILAKQLYEQARIYLPDYIGIALITADSKENPKELFANGIDFIIGTQALLHREIDGGDLALVMSDEQHRFGTKQRHYLEKLATDSHTKTTNKKPHILQFSATPIPRTMAMLESKMIDVSIIKQLPYPKDITTTIISKPQFKELLIHIKQEIALHHQIAIIYPLVEESEAIDYMSLSEGASFWQRNFDKVFVTSGQDKDKERVLEEFANGGNILLATTLIEVGISLPKLSTIVILAPERMGLATLHQLRGRVSRNGLKGYCFLYTHSPESTRLHEFARHISGFDIAELDLKYRKSGDLLDGKRQSGEQWIWADLAHDGKIFEIIKERF